MQQSVFLILPAKKGVFLKPKGREIASFLHVLELAARLAIFTGL